MYSTNIHNIRYRNYSIFQELRHLDSPRQLPNFCLRKFLQTLQSWPPWFADLLSPIESPHLQTSYQPYELKRSKNPILGFRRFAHRIPAFLWCLFLPRIIVNKARRKVPNLNLRFKQKNTCLHTKKNTHTKKKRALNMVLYSIGHQLYRFCCFFLISMNSSSQTWDTDHIIFASTQLGDEYSTGTCSTSNVEKCWK